jgi:hypothetical protein
VALEIERRLLEIALEESRNGDTPHDEPPSEDDDLRAMLIDWPQFWAHDHTDAEWLAEPLIPAERSVALFAPGGEGKSLLALWLTANLATGRDPFTGRAQPPVDVLYLDYEMTEADLSERLEQMGYGPDVDLGHLHYALLPSLPGLDQPDGGRAVVRLAELCDASLVIIDTFGRAVHGDENDADTVRAWYRWTGLHLKAAGRAFLRADHAGKDLAKGQRGTSAKNDDVDIVWQMTARDGGIFMLDAKKRRMGWVPLKVEIRRIDEPLSYQLVDGDSWPAGTKECAQALDELEVATDAGYRAAGRTLSEAGRGARGVVVRAAQKYRRVRSETLHFVGDKPVDKCVPSSGTHPPEEHRDAPADAPDPDDLFAQVDEPGRTTGRTGTHPPSSQTVRASHVVGRTAGRTPERPDDWWKDEQF